MSFIAIINDVHIGTRNDSVVFAAHQARFWREELIPYLVKNKIKKLYMLGDVFDRRKFINFRSLHSAHENLFGPLAEAGIEVTVSIGNHDIFYRETNRINSPKLLLEGYKNVTVLEEFTELGTHCICPWINDENEEEMITKIKETKCPVILGHFEIAGIEAERGMVMEHGMDGSLFDKFLMVGSGHYHHRSTTKNITYFGCQYQLTWSDYESVKGFHVYDTKAQDFEFVPSKLEMFHKIYFNDDMKIDSLPDMKDKCVKVVVPAKRDNYKKDRIVDAINAMNPYEIHVIDEGLMFTESSDEEEVEITSELSTVELLKKMISDQLEVGEDIKKSLSGIIDSLHSEALTSE